MKNLKVKKGFVAVLAALPLLTVSVPALAAHDYSRDNDRNRMIVRDRDRDDFSRNMFFRDRDRDDFNRNIYINRVVVRDNDYRFGTDFRTFDQYFGTRFSSTCTPNQKMLLERFLHSLTPAQRDDLMDFLSTLTPYQRNLLMDFLNSLNRNQRHIFVNDYRSFHDRNWNTWDRSHRGDDRLGHVPTWFNAY